MPYLIDSDVLIDLSRGNAAAREYLDALPEGWGISQVSALELLVGARDNRDLGEIDAFPSAYVIVALRSSTGHASVPTRQAVRESSWTTRFRFARCGHRHRRGPHFGDQEP